MRHPPRPLRLAGCYDGALGGPRNRVPRSFASPEDRLRPQKGGRVAAERDEFLRATWRVMVAASVASERLVFVDERGMHTSLSPIYGYAHRGERLRLPVLRNRGSNTTPLCSMTHGGMGPSLAVEGATTARVFEAYVEEVLAAPRLRPGQVVVMNNLGAHRPKRVRELIEGGGCVLYLPAYSPDYNPIEEAFAKLKNLLCKAGAGRGKEALVEASDEALYAIAAADARGFFEHAGYHQVVQLP